MRQKSINRTLIKNYVHINIEEIILTRKQNILKNDKITE
jgi:hypothetical protein